MLKNSVLATTLILFGTACTSVLSKTTDEDVWNDYFKEQKLQKEGEERTIASVPAPRAGIKILREILDGMPFRNYLINCESQECYQSQLVIAYDQAFQRVKEQNIAISTEEYGKEQKRFLSRYSYENMLSLVDNFHQVLLSGVELRSAHRAVALAQACEESPAIETQIQLSSFSPYLGGISYLPRNYYYCLNEHWKRELDQLLKETSDRLGVVIKTDEAKRWILHRQVAPIYRKTLNDLFNKRKQEEVSRWNLAWQETEKKIDWTQPIEELIRKEVPAFRGEYRFLNVEALLTEKKLSKK